MKSLLLLHIFLILLAVLAGTALLARRINVAPAILLMLAGTALAFVLFFELIGEVGPARSTVITYINPAVAIALGVALLGEPVTLGMLVGFPLILAGSWLATAH